MTEYPDTTPGPQCRAGSRPAERRGLKGRCDGCFGWHPLGISPTRGWQIRPHTSSPAQGHECPGCPYGTVYDPPRYSGEFPPTCDRCLADTPDGHDDRGRPYWISEDGTPEFRDTQALA